ncbi:helix-turn-helix domain-containing protein [Streptomyces sp. NPDC056549]|uniref:helix-turn-helix domain-containing protein n=1 Tax=Streptomyces sp. NPDC056549 TaxID=3345864 RepID=UPI0036A0F776
MEEVGQMVLEPFGVTEAEERAYRFVLGVPDCTVAEVAEAIGAESGAARRLLKALEAKGLVCRLPGPTVRYQGAAPDLAIEVLALVRHRQIEQAKLATAELGEIWAAAERSRNAPVEVVHGRDVNTQRFLQTQLAARREVLTFDLPPYLEEGIEPQHELQVRRMAEGVRYRTVYDRSALAERGQMERVFALVRAGEQARVYDGVPLKMLVTDRSAGLVPFTVSGVRRSVVLDESPLLHALVSLFELVWERAAPLWSSTPTGVDAVNERLLGFAAAGYTDESIARMTGLSKRTVERRMRQMMDRLGARTRFQAGLQAGRSGLLG